MGGLKAGTIVEVEYRELVTGPGYNNTTIGATARVAEGAHPEQTLAELHGWVKGEFGRLGREREGHKRLSAAVAELRVEGRRLERAITARRRELSLLHGLRGRLNHLRDRLAARFPRLAPRSWRLGYTDEELDSVPF